MGANNGLMAKNPRWPKNTTKPNQPSKTTAAGMENFGDTQYTANQTNIKKIKVGINRDMDTLNCPMRRKIPPPFRVHLD